MLVLQHNLWGGEFSLDKIVVLLDFPAYYIIYKYIPAHFSHI